MKYLLMAGTALAMVSVPTSVVAQEGAAPAAPDGSAAQEDSGGLNEIIVTAQRRSQSLQDVPIAVTAVTTDTLTRAGVADTSQISQVAPGITLTQNNASLTPFIRGVGSPNIAPGTDSAVAFYVDDVYVVSATAAILGLNNIERIEVLRGPQGTLFGRNTTGGLIQVVTKDPSQTPEMNFSATYASYDTVTAQGYVAGPLTSNVAASVAVMKSYQGRGFARNVFRNVDVEKTDQSAVRGEIQFDPSERFSINLAADYSRRDSDVGQNRVMRPGSYYSDGAVGVDDPRLTRSGVIPNGKNSQFSFAAKMGYVLDWGEISSVTAYSGSSSRVIYDQDITPLALVDVDIFQKERSFQQELLLNAAIGKLDLTAGLFYFHSRARYLPNGTRSVALPTLNVGRFANLGSYSYAGFAQAALAVTDTTNLTAGLRYTHEKKTGEGTYIAFSGHPLGEGAVVPAGTTAGKRQLSVSKPTWRLAIDQKLGEDILVYVSYNRGFKSGGYNSVNVTQPAVNPEVLDAYEGGIKSELLDRQLRFNLGGYYYKYSNIQLTQVVAGGTQLLNAARARAHGVEFEALFEPRLGFGELSLRASGAYAAGRYKSFPNGPVFLPNPVTAVPAGVTCPAVRPTTPGNNLQCSAELSGNTLVRMPKWTITAGAEYAFPVGDGKLSLSSDLYHSSSFFFEPSNRTTNPAYTIVNAQIAYSILDGRRHFRLFGRNLTDAIHYQYGNESAFGDAVVAGPPRMFGVGIDYKFGR